MMITALTILMGGGALILSADAQVNELPQLFVAACLDGKATLSSADAATIGFDGLPHELQQRLGKPQSAQVWRLNRSGRAYLYVLSYEPARNTTPRICGVASDEMSYGAAADIVEKRVTGSVYPRTARSIQWLDPKGGYNAMATTAGGFKVLQINWLSDEQREILARGYQDPR
jgi:hypothetical protein